MAQYDYTTIIMGAPDKKGRRWVITPADPNKMPGDQVGEAENPRFLGKIWQGVRLLETALKEMDHEELLWNSIATKKTILLYKSLENVPAKPNDSTWLNYIRCHDDIGCRCRKAHANEETGEGCNQKE